MDNKKVVIKKTKKRGRGVFAKTRILKGEVIAVFDGPTYDGDFEDWTDDLYYHAIQYGREKWRDSKGIARLINHSCDPNCGIRSLFKVVAMRDIMPGEEVTWDYEMTEKNPYWRMKCHCGTEICRKVIGDYSRMPRSIRKKYGNYISAWLRPRRRASSK